MAGGCGSGQCQGVAVDSGAGLGQAVGQVRGMSGISQGGSEGQPRGTHRVVMQSRHRLAVTVQENREEVMVRKHHHHLGVILLWS